jgi:hypothetical protein
MAELKPGFDIPGIPTGTEVTACEEVIWSVDEEEFESIKEESVETILCCCCSSWSTFCALVAASCRYVRYSDNTSRANVRNKIPIHAIKYSILVFTCQLEKKRQEPVEREKNDPILHDTITNTNETNVRNGKQNTKRKIELF